MMTDAFSCARLPHIDFGSGRRRRLPAIIRQFGEKILLVTGRRSFDDSPLCRALLAELEQAFTLRRQKVSGEPSPQLVDQAVGRHREFAPDCVVAVGGGSVMDAARAIAGLLSSGDPVTGYLEGVGQGRTCRTPATPLIALPTTAGSGSETSRNAVLSVTGPNGFKKSFRDDRLIARHVILDPELTVLCPARTTAACGMDALTQLLESYVSVKASPMTDALALSGLQKVAVSLVQAAEQGDDLRARADMLYASSISGITLTNAGLGSVHGLASPLGAFFPIPHGEACGAMLFAAVNGNIRALRERAPEQVALSKYAEAGRILCRRTGMNDETAQAALLDLLQEWTLRLQMPRLSAYRVGEKDIPKIVAHASSGSMGTNPVALAPDELTALVHSCL